MKKISDVSINLPTEYIDSLSEVIYTGIQRSKINDKIKHELSDWWDAEKEFIEEELKKNN